jgi:hypothetical protein
MYAFRPQGVTPVFLASSAHNYLARAMGLQQRAFPFSLKSSCLPALSRFCPRGFCPRNSREISFSNGLSAFGVTELFGKGNGFAFIGIIIVSSSLVVVSSTVFSPTEFVISLAGCFTGNEFSFQRFSAIGLVVSTSFVVVFISFGGKWSSFAGFIVCFFVFHSLQIVHTFVGERALRSWGICSRGCFVARRRRATGDKRAGFPAAFTQ